MNTDPALEAWRRAHAEHLAKPGALAELARAQGVSPVEDADELAYVGEIPAHELAAWQAALAERYASTADLERALAEQREQIAAGIEAMAANYPKSVFRPGSTAPDGIAGNAMRHAYRTAARMVREGRLPGDAEAAENAPQRLPESDSATGTDGHSEPASVACSGSVAASEAER